MKQPLKREVASALMRHGVLEAREIDALTAQDEIAATIFDNLLRMKTPISLRALRALGCIDDANLVSARQLTTEQFHAIIQKGGVIGS